MRAVVQRVEKASVEIEGRSHAAIGPGLLVLLGVEDEDGEADAVWLSQKVAHLRIFRDEQGLMNLALRDIRGEALVISQFTLFASTKKGQRPYFARAARPEKARPLYESFAALLGQEIGHTAATGIFGATMKISLINDGPVTLILDSRNRE